MERKQGKIHLEIGKEPELGTFRHAIWAIKRQLPAMKTALIERGVNDYTNNHTYKRRFDRAWAEYFDKHPMKFLLAAYDIEQCQIWVKMQDCLAASVKSKDMSVKIEKFEEAWEAYLELKKKQISSNGAPHPKLLPPGFDRPVNESKVCVDNGTTQTDEPELSDGLAEITTQTDLSYTNGTQWTKAKFTLPNNAGLTTMPFPFSNYRPEEYLKDQLERGGLDNYCSEALEKSGQVQCSSIRRVRIKNNATKLWQEGLDLVATARHELDVNSLICASHYRLATELLAELNSRLCHNMTVRGSLHKNPDLKDCPEPEGDICTGALSAEELESELAETTEQHEATEGIATARVDLTKFQFDQLEKIILTTKIDKNHFTRAPKRNRTGHYTFYKIKSEEVANLFFKQTNIKEPLTIYKNGRKFKAEISKMAPMKIKFGQRNKKTCKLTVSMHYRKY